MPDFAAEAPGAGIRGTMGVGAFADACDDRYPGEVMTHGRRTANGILRIVDGEHDASRLADVGGSVGALPDR